MTHGSVVMIMIVANRGIGRRRWSMLVRCLPVCRSGALFVIANERFTSLRFVLIVVADHKNPAFSDPGLRHYPPPALHAGELSEKFLVRPLDLAPPATVCLFERQSLLGQAYLQHTGRLLIQFIKIDWQLARVQAVTSRTNLQSLLLRTFDSILGLSAGREEQDQCQEWGKARRRRA